MTTKDATTTNPGPSRWLYLLAYWVFDQHNATAPTMQLEFATAIVWASDDFEALRQGRTTKIWRETPNRVREHVVAMPETVEALNLRSAALATLAHVENMAIERVGNQCTLCHSFRSMLRDAAQRVGAGGSAQAAIAAATDFQLMQWSDTLDEEERDQPQPSAFRASVVAELTARKYVKDAEGRWIQPWP